MANRMRTHKHTPSPLFLPLPSPGILTLPVQFCSAALCRDVGTVRGNIRSLSGTQVCRGKVLNLVITLAIVLLCFIHKGSCVQRPRRGFVEKGGCRERRRHQLSGGSYQKQLPVSARNAGRQADILQRLPQERRT